MCPIVTLSAVHIPNAISVTSALPVFCGDCHAEILVMSPDLQRDHQKKIGDAMSNAFRDHKCLKNSR